MASEEERRQGNQSVERGGEEEKITEQRHLAGHVGPLVVDMPRALGYYGGLTLALSVGLLEPPLALFIAAAPFFKLLNRPNASQTLWMAGEVLEGSAIPVGGSASPVIRVSQDSGPKRAPRALGRALNPLRDIWTDARQTARGDRYQVLLPGSAP